MPTLTQINEHLVQVVVSEKEVMEIRAEDNCSPTIGEVVQDLVTYTMGLEKEDEYWLSDKTSAVDCTWCDKSRVWKYVYRVKDGDDLVFG